MSTIVALENAEKSYPLGSVVVQALRGIDLTIEAGEFTSIAGPSGSGKTTLLNLVGCVDVPTVGSVRIDGRATESLSDAELTRLRLHKLGFIFQSFNLVPVLNVYQNVEFPLLLQGGVSAATRRERVCPLSSSIDPVSSPAFIASGAPSRAPWSPDPESFLRTSPPRIWTRSPARTFSI